MQPKFGYTYEEMLCKKMNGKKVGDIEEVLQKMIYQFMGQVNDETIVYVYRFRDEGKADICIKTEKEEKLLSVKYGDKNSVHTESIHTFRKFILYNNCGWDILEAYLRYHYADGTLDGSGKMRMAVSEYKTLHHEEVEKINRRFNRKEMRLAAYERFLFRGIVPKKKKIDGILHCKNGEVQYATCEEIVEYLEHKAKMESSGVHFSRLFVQPMARNLNYDLRYEGKRHYVQLKWFDLYISMCEIRYKRENGNWLDIL